MCLRRWRRPESGTLTVPLVRCTLAWLLAAVPLAALGQASFGAALVSDYRYRGLSLSGERPAAQLSANYDTALGVYAGVHLSRARLRYTDASSVAIGYAGYAQRFGANAGWDAGVSATRFRGAGHYDYRELYVGISMERIAARLSASPRYYGTGGRSVYAEVNGSIPLSGWLDLSGHAGYLHAAGAARPWSYRVPARMDATIGLGSVFDGWTMQLAWSATREGAALYPGAAPNHARRLVVSGARGF